MRRNGFTLIEMLVVMGIIATLTGAAMAGYSAFVKHAQKVRALELVHQVQTALVSQMQKDETWPRLLQSAQGAPSCGRLTSETGVALGAVMNLTMSSVDQSDGTKKFYLTGHDRFGIVTQWATDLIKKSGSSVSQTKRLPNGGTIQDHVLYYAIDHDFDGITEVSGKVGKDSSVRVRASACVWCCGRDGVLGTPDDVKSWSKGMEVH